MEQGWNSRHQIATGVTTTAAWDAAAIRQAPSVERHDELTSHLEPSEDDVERVAGAIKQAICMDTLADALPREINRVRQIQQTYKDLRGLPNVIVEPQIEMMERDITDGIAAAALGDVVAMLRAHEVLKGYNQ